MFVRSATLSLIAAALLLASQPLPATARSLQIAQAPTPTAEDQISEAVRLNNQGAGLIYKKLVGPDDLKEAMTLFEQALKTFRQYGAKGGEVNSLTNIGYVHLRLGEVPKALENLEQALTIARQTSYKEGEWIALSYMAEAYAGLNQNPKALENYLYSLAILRSLAKENPKSTDYRSSEVILLTDIAATYFRSGQMPKALENYQQALSLQRGGRDLIGSAQTLNNLGVVYANQGNYGQAIAHYEEALKVVTELGNCYRKDRGPKLCYFGDEAAILNNLAGVYFSLGQPEKALEYAQRANAIYRRLQGGDSGESERSLRLLYDALGQKSQVLMPAGSRAVVGNAFGEDAFLQQSEALNQLNLGQVYANLGQNEAALQRYQQALTLYEQANSPVGTATALNFIGQVYQRQGRSAEAATAHQQAIALYQKISDRAGEGVALSNLGQVYEQQGDIARALPLYQQALERHRSVGDRASEGITLTSQGRALLSSGKAAESVMALSSAVEVWEALRPGLSDENRVALFETQATTYRLLQQALVAQKKTDASLEIAERGRARAFVDLLARRIRETQREMRSAELTQTPTVPQIRQIAKSQNATLVQYSTVDSGTLYVWVVQPTGDIAFRQVDLRSRLGSAGSLAEYVQVVRSDAIGVRGLGVAAKPGTRQPKPSQSTAPTASLKDLHQILIDPIADLLPRDSNQRVVLIPQGALYLVPFAALQAADGSYLVQKHPLVVVPSIQVLALTRQQHSRHSFAPLLDPTASLLVGNPTMPKIVLEPGFPPEPLAPLPGAEREVTAIAQFLKATPLIGSRATETAVIQQMPKARLIHLATHGLMDETRGMGSAIALAASGREDGLLTAEEILDLPLQAELVVLSACDTGRGRITGDGVIGLSRSLISAGASSVIVSLWSVPDAPTAALMTEFYRNLQKQPDKAQALRGAMLTLMRDNPDPRDWAAFTLVGEAE